MSFDKAIKYNKEHRKEYNDSRAFDRTCRCHGSCSYCERNRRYREFRLKEKTKYDIKEYEYDTDTGDDNKESDTSDWI